MAQQKYFDGNTYSKVLVARTKAILSEEKAGLAVTRDNIAEKLGRSRQMVSGVISGSRSFGRALFEHLAHEEGMELRDFLLGLVEWERHHKSLAGAKERCLWDRKLPDLVELRERLTRNLRRRFLVARNAPNRPELRFAAESVLRKLLVELTDLLVDVTPSSEPEATILFLGSSPGEGLRRNQTLHHKASSGHSDVMAVETLQDEDVPSHLADAADSMWNTLSDDEDGDDDKIPPLWIQSPNGDEELCSDDTRFIVNVPCYQNRFHLMHDFRELSVQVSLHVSMVLDNHDTEIRNYISDAVGLFSHLVEYVCLGTVGDVMSAAYSASNSYDHATHALLSGWTKPPIERAEAAFSPWLESVTKRRTGSSRLAKAMRRLLAVDVWVFNGWDGEFFFNPEMKLHALTRRSQRLQVLDTASGGQVTYATFYKKHLAKLRPRPQEGKSIECIGVHRYVKISQNESDGLRAEVKVLLAGTKIGVPIKVHSAPHLAAVAWLRFDGDLCKDDVSCVVSSVWNSMSPPKQFGGFKLEPLFQRPQKNQAKCKREQAEEAIME